MVVIIMLILFFVPTSKIYSILNLRLLDSLVPRVCGVILEACSVQDLASDQYLGDELMFNMLLLSEVLCVPGKLHTRHKYFKASSANLK